MPADRDRRAKGTGASAISSYSSSAITPCSPRSKGRALWPRLPPSSTLRAGPYARPIRRRRCDTAAKVRRSSSAPLLGRSRAKDDFGTVERAGGELQAEALAVLVWPGATDLLPVGLAVAVLRHAVDAVRRTGFGVAVAHGRSLSSVRPRFSRPRCGSPSCAAKR